MVTVSYKIDHIFFNQFKELTKFIKLNEMEKLLLHTYREDFSVFILIEVTSIINEAQGLASIICPNDS